MALFGSTDDQDAPVNTLVESYAMPPATGDDDPQPPSPTPDPASSAPDPTSSIGDYASDGGDADETGVGLGGVRGFGMGTKIRPPKPSQQMGAGLDPMQMLGVQPQGSMIDRYLGGSTDPQIDNPHWLPTDATAIAADAPPMSVAWAPDSTSNQTQAEIDRNHSYDIHTGSSATLAKLNDLLGPDKDQGFLYNLTMATVPWFRQQQMQDKMTKILALRSLYNDQFNAESRNALEHQQPTLQAPAGGQGQSQIEKLVTDADTGNLTQVFPDGSSKVVTKSVTHFTPPGADVGPLPDTTENVPVKGELKAVPTKQVGIHPVSDSASGWVEVGPDGKPVYRANPGHVLSNAKKDKPEANAEGTLNAAQVKIEQMLDAEESANARLPRSQRKAFNRDQRRKDLEKVLLNTSDSKGGGSAIKTMRDPATGKIVLAPKK